MCANTTVEKKRGRCSVAKAANPRGRVLRARQGKARHGWGVVVYAKAINTVAVSPAAAANPGAHPCATSFTTTNFLPTSSSDAYCILLTALRTSMRKNISSGSSVS